MNKRVKLITLQVLSALLFAWHIKINTGAVVTWLVPLLLLVLIVINSAWFTRFVSWVIFAGSFFCLLVVLSAFTLRWRLEPGFSPIPFYKALIMYSLFVYVSLAQIKILGDAVQEPAKPTEV